MHGEEHLCGVLCLENQVWRKGGADAAVPDLRRSVRQVPDLMPTETDVSLGQARGRR